MKVNLSKEELELLLTCTYDYRWVGDFPSGELEKMKRKLKYHIKKENEKCTLSE